MELDLVLTNYIKVHGSLEQSLLQGPLWRDAALPGLQGELAEDASGHVQLEHLLSWMHRRHAAGRQGVALHKLPGEKTHNYGIKTDRTTHHQMFSYMDWWKRIFQKSRPEMGPICGCVFVVLDKVVFARLQTF